ncbi:hypothetical protein [Aeromonas popoffii]|nr:hypothetical protein [Aeromonas popoffii]
MKLQIELIALLGELECIDLSGQERRSLTDRIQRMMPDQAE